MAPVHSGWREEVFTVVIKALRGLPPSLLHHSFSSSTSSPHSGHTETLLFLDCAGMPPTLGHSLCLEHSSPRFISSSPSSVHSDVTSLKPDMTYFHCNPYILVPYPSFGISIPPWNLLPSDILCIVLVFFFIYCLFLPN